MNRFGLALLQGFVSFLCAAQVPLIQIQKSLGGSNLEHFSSLKQTYDNGYILAGYTESSDGDVSTNHGGGDCWVIKLDVSGNIQWEKTYGGSNKDYATDVLQTADSGYFFVGYTASTDGDVTMNHPGAYADYWAVKTDKNGVVIWQKTYGGTSEEEANSVLQTKDGGYMIAGISWSLNGDITNHHGDSTRPDIWIVKTDPAGIIQWANSYGGTGAEWTPVIRSAADKGYFVSGSSDSNDGDVTGHHQGQFLNYDGWLLKLDSTGAIKWQKSYGGTNDDEPWQIETTLDEGFIMAGRSRSNDGDFLGFHGGFDDYFIVKADSVGVIQWTRLYGGTDDDEACSVKQMTNGNYLVFGSSVSQDGDVTGLHGSGSFDDYWLLEIDPVGNLVWQNCYGGTSADDGIAVELTQDGGCVIGGESYSNDGDISGHHGSAGYADISFVKLGSVYSVNPIKRQKFQIYPIPSAGIVTITSLGGVNKLRVVNALGQQVKDVSILFRGKKDLDLSDLENGIYFIEAQTSEGTFTQKLILNH